MDTPRIIRDTVHKEKWTYWIDIEDVSRKYPPRTELTGYKPKHEGEILAFGRAVYETQPQESTDMLLRLSRHLCHKYAPGNMWLLPTYERMPYPYAVYWPLACAFETERTHKTRFDWFLWMDDDVLATPGDFDALMDAADPHLRPFVSSLPYDRFEPHHPAVTEYVDGKPKIWNKAPDAGTWGVSHVGLCMALFHRSLFDKVEEPWFGVCPPTLNGSGMAPDYWWSVQMNKAGISPYVCCDSKPVHLGRKLHVDKSYSERWQDVSPKAANYPELASIEVSGHSGAIIADPPKIRNGRNTEDAK